MSCGCTLSMPSTCPEVSTPVRTLGSGVILKSMPLSPDVTLGIAAQVTGRNFPIPRNLLRHRLCGRLQP